MRVTVEELEDVLRRLPNPDSITNSEYINVHIHEEGMAALDVYPITDPHATTELRMITFHKVTQRRGPETRTTWELDI